MRRWFEFGLNGNPATGTWEMLSSRWGGNYPVAFVSMPHKSQLFSVINALTSARQLQAIWLIQHDQGVDPDPNCEAQHIPRAFDSLSISTQQFFANPSVMPWGGYPIFNENGTFTGSFSESFFGPVYSEPPDPDGA